MDKKTETENKKIVLKKQKVVSVLTWIYFIPFAFLVLLAFGTGCVTTIYYDLYQEADLPRFGKENIFLLLILTVLVLWIFRMILTRAGEKCAETGRMDRKMILGVLILAGGISLYLVLAVRGLATNDALRLDQIINKFMQGDYTELTEPGGYLFIYPFQIGYVMIGQLLYLLFGASNYMVYQLLNIAAILITIGLLHRITWELFENNRICHLMALLSGTCLFLFVYATFVYGDIWSLAPETAALYLTVRYLKYHHVSDILWAGVMNGCAVVLKTNAYIALVAMVIILILDALRSTTAADEQTHQYNIRKKIGSRILLILFLILLSKGMTEGINFAYAKAIGMDAMPKGVPSSTYFAMAMQEGAGEGGWYDGYNVNTYNQCGYDRSLTNQTAITGIRERLADFEKRPLHMGRFYIRKFLSQWDDPTFICMRNLELTSRHVEGQPAIVYSIVYGMGRTIFQWIMNISQNIIYLGAVCYCIGIVKKKKLDFTQAFLILFIFGGMLFHELWEGSSRYVIRYYICLLPIAAYGLDEAYQKMKSLSVR